MNRIIIYHGDDSSVKLLVKALYNLLKQEEVFIVGVTGDSIGRQLIINGKSVPFVPLDLVNPGIADYVVVNEVKIPWLKTLQDFMRKGFLEYCIIKTRTICVPNFTFNKYKMLHKQMLSIISIHCAGGLLSHLFGLPFRSPFVNMFLSDDDFLILLENDLRQMLNGELLYDSLGYEEILHMDYPIYNLNGLLLHMNHYKDIYEAKNKWDERKRRINYYNLFVLMFTDNQETLIRFDKLPFAKKNMFCPI